MKKLQKNEQRILKLADELEKQQKDNSYKNANICEEMQISVAMFHRYKPKAMLELQKRAEFKRSLINDTYTHEINEGLRNGLKSDLEIELQLCKIAFGEIDVMETTSTPDGFIEFNRKPTPGEMINAMKELWKKRGTYAPDKIDGIISAYNVTLNLNK
jgi:hypothetical protein